MIFPSLLATMGKFIIFSHLCTFAVRPHYLTHNINCFIHIPTFYWYHSPFLKRNNYLGKLLQLDQSDMTDVIFFPVRDEFASTLSDCVPLGQLIDPSVYETLNTAQNKENQFKSIAIASKSCEVYESIGSLLSLYHRILNILHRVFQSK